MSRVRRDRNAAHTSDQRRRVVTTTARNRADQRTRWATISLGGHITFLKYSGTSPHMP
jgi:hypothetical protein